MLVLIGSNLLIVQAAIKNGINKMKRLIENLISFYDIICIENVGVSGLSIVLNEYVNALSDEEFSIWVDYHLKTCTNTEILGYNSKIIYICRKEK